MDLRALILEDEGQEIRRARRITIQSFSKRNGSWSLTENRSGIPIHPLRIKREDRLHLMLLEHFSGHRRIGAQEKARAVENAGQPLENRRSKIETQLARRA